MYYYRINKNIRISVDIHPQIVDSGAKVRVLEALLEGFDEKVVIPRANVELI